MHIILNNSSMVPIYEQLMAQIKAAVLNKEIETGALLPSVRSLAAQLKISALTVKKAYDRLEEEGFVVTVHGKGTYAAEINTNLEKETRRLFIEKQFAEAITRARASGMSREEIKELFDILLED